MTAHFDHTAMEARWTGRWQRRQTYVVDLQRAERPYYNLMMFPYPSAEGLHVGNVFAFVGSDVHGRFMRARGREVFEPMGFDAFGIHSENRAMALGVHPSRMVPENIQRFRRQLQRLGAIFDWSHEIDTTSPAYYRWTQWIFVKLFQAGLAYRKAAEVNWCPSCRTVLANEQAAEGRCERCQAEVRPRKMRQWFFRITAYADRLSANLDWIDWSPVTTAAQRRWIGWARQTGRPGAGSAPRVHCRLHDWCISRQRYWGTPIPIIHCRTCGPVAVPVDELPVRLPHIESFRPDGTGRSPLARDEQFVAAICPRCRRPARRETDVCDNFLDSAWYSLRYPSAGRTDVPFDPALTEKWLPVDMYIGGHEHAVLHLLYTRFITMALNDLGWIGFAEPFKRFRAHGLITKDGAKMSKSKGNVVNPDAYLDRFGADTFRMALMFHGPFHQNCDFTDAGMTGMHRFLGRLWRYVTQTAAANNLLDGSPTDGAVRTRVHQTIAQVTENLEALRYHTAIAALMQLLGGLTGQRRHHRESVRVLLQLLCPLAPFITHELWQRAGGDGMIGDVPWPRCDARPARVQTATLVVQVNGRKRVTIELPVGSPKAVVQQAALASPRVRERIGQSPIARIILVPDRLLNIVTDDT